MKIACWGYYGKQNLGDDLILAELCKYIQKSAPDADITVFSDEQNPEKVCNSGTIQCCPRSAKALLRASVTQDILICGPGGLMPQRGTGKLLLWIVLAMIMRIRRKSLLFLGLGIGQQNFEHAIDRFLLKILVNLSREFVVRQKGVNDALKTQKVLETADVVFAVEQENIMEKQPKSIVFSFASVFGNLAGDECCRFVANMAKTAETLLASGYTIHLVEFTKDRDMHLYRQLLQHLSNTENVVIHPYEGNPYSMIQVFQKAQLCICMRFHSLVLAAVTHTPCCVIAYSDKMDDVAQRLGITDYTMQICPISNLYYGRLISFDGEKFNEVLNRLIDNHETLSLHMSNAVNDLQKQARTNWNVLAEVIRRHAGK